ncbi:hypothetical protein [Nonomuraea sp. NPDC050310]|uniref:hypothetical protein n=1 Tax=unclassified Nonomuraea TaxID=2593643 RepID=UPI003405407E
MSCEHLVCAACAHPVIEGRCATCRANRERLHRHGFALTPAMVAAVLLAALFLTLVLRQLLGT